MEAVSQVENPLVVPEPKFGRKSNAGEGAFFWLCAFFLVYCARPEDWIPGLKYLPLAKITAFFAIWGLFQSLGHTKRKTKDLPLESKYLLAMIILLFIGAVLSPVWKGGAIVHTIDFSKVYIAWVMVFLLITDFRRLRTIVFIQAGSVAVAAGISIIKGHSLPRLSGALGGMYSNPNDLAFCIVIALPFCIWFMLAAKKGMGKVFWMFGIFTMLAALLMTASRSGMIELAVTMTYCLYHFGIKGRRFYLIVAAIVVGGLLMLIVGNKMKERLESLESGVSNEERDGSYEARLYLMQRAVDAIEEYPILGIGVNNFMTYSGDWHEVHMSYLQIAAEGGIPVFILYLLFFKRGFRNLKKLRKMKDLQPEEVIFVGALHSSRIGFVVGALFAPVAFQFFAYFAVAYTSTLIQIKAEEKGTTASGVGSRQQPLHYLEVYGNGNRTGTLAPVR